MCVFCRMEDQERGYTTLPPIINTILPVLNVEATPYSHVRSVAPAT
jgi:hypothetical protein